MTKNATVGSCEYTKKVPDVIGSRNYTFPTASIKKAVEMIEASEKPFVFVGGGCIASQASAPLKEFVEKIDAPVTDTLMGKEHMTALIHVMQGCLECTGLKQVISVYQNVTY